MAQRKVKAPTNQADDQPESSVVRNKQGRWVPRPTAKTAKAKSSK